MNIKKQLISVIIPVYNGSNYLRDAVNSALEQTYSNVEIIVIDDGSNDDTPEIIASYGNNIRGIRKVNGGVSSALNLGILNAKGEYLCWLSHDDTFQNNKLEVQINILLENPKISVCYSDYNIINEKSEIIGKMGLPYYPKEYFVRHLFQAMFVCGSTVMIKKSCFDTVGYFDETLKYSQDADMWLKIASKFEFIHTDLLLLNWRFHVSQGSKRQFKMAKDKKRYLQVFLKSIIIDEIFPEIKSSAIVSIEEARAYNYLGNVLEKRHREPFLAIHQFISSIKTWHSFKNVAYLKLFQLFIYKVIYIYIGKYLMNFIRNTSPTKSVIAEVDFKKYSSLIKY